MTANSNVHPVRNASLKNQPSASGSHSCTDAGSTSSGNHGCVNLQYFAGIWPSQLLSLAAAKLLSHVSKSTVYQNLAGGTTRFVSNWHNASIGGEITQNQVTSFTGRVRGELSHITYACKRISCGSKYSSYARTPAKIALFERSCCIRSGPRWWLSTN